MAKIWQNPDLIYDHAFQVSKDSADHVLALVQKKLRNKRTHPYATGELASSYRIDVEEVSPDGVYQWIRSDSIYASAIEEGVWVGGRGPHISGSGNVVAGGGYTGKGRDEVRATVQRQFGRDMSKWLREL